MPDLPRKWTEVHAEILENYIDLFDQHIEFGTSEGAREIVILLRSYAHSLRRTVGSPLYLRDKIS